MLQELIIKLLDRLDSNPTSSIRQNTIGYHITIVYTVLVQGPSVEFRLLVQL